MPKYLRRRLFGWEEIDREQYNKFMRIVNAEEGSKTAVIRRKMGDQAVLKVDDPPKQLPAVAAVVADGWIRVYSYDRESGRVEGGWIYAVASGIDGSVALKEWVTSNEGRYEFVGEVAEEISERVNAVAIESHGVIEVYVLPFLRGESFEKKEVKAALLKHVYSGGVPSFSCQNEAFGKGWLKVKQWAASQGYAIFSGSGRRLW